MSLNVHTVFPVHRNTVEKKLCKFESEGQEFVTFWDTVPAGKIIAKITIASSNTYLFFPFRRGNVSTWYQRNQTDQNIERHCHRMCQFCWWEFFPAFSSCFMSSLAEHFQIKWGQIYLTVYPIWLRVAVKYLVAKNLDLQLHIIWSFLAKSVLAILFLLKFCFWNTIRISKYWKFTFQFGQILRQPESMLETEYERSRIFDVRPKPKFSF